MRRSRAAAPRAPCAARAPARWARRGRRRWLSGESSTVTLRAPMRWSALSRCRPLGDQKRTSPAESGAGTAMIGSRKVSLHVRLGQIALERSGGDARDGQGGERQPTPAQGLAVASEHGALGLHHPLLQGRQVVRRLAAGDLGRGSGPGSLPRPASCASCGPPRGSSRREHSKLGGCGFASSRAHWSGFACGRPGCWWRFPAESTR